MIFCLDFYLVGICKYTATIIVGGWGTYFQVQFLHYIHCIQVIHKFIRDSNERKQQNLVKLQQNIIFHFDDKLHTSGSLQQQIHRPILAQCRSSCRRHRAPYVDLSASPDLAPQSKLGSQPCGIRTPDLKPMLN